MVDLFELGVDDWESLAKHLEALLLELVDEFFEFGLFVFDKVEFVEALLIFQELDLVLGDDLQVLALHSFELCTVDGESGAEFLLKQEEGVEVVVGEVFERVDGLDLFDV